MQKLTTVDSLTIDVLVDNTTDSYSSKPHNVVPEFSNVLTAGAQELSGATLCCAQLGFSVMLSAINGIDKHKMLFDAGPEGPLFVRNCKNLGVRLDDVETIAVSHGHWDHMGALSSALAEITATSGRRVDCHVNPGMFLERGVRLSDGRVVPFEKVPTLEELTHCGADPINKIEERTLLNDFFYLSGEIPRLTEFEKGRPDHLCRDDSNSEWRSDPFLLDERYLAVQVKDKGLVVFSSCSHAGIINVLLDAQKRFDGPLYCVFGGLHLVGALEQIIPETIEGLRQFAPAHIVPAHCTGWRAQNALINAFGPEVVIPCAVGSKYVF